MKNKAKKITSILLASALSASCVFAMSACENEGNEKLLAEIAKLQQQVEDSQTQSNENLLAEIAKLQQQLHNAQTDVAALKKAVGTPADTTPWNYGAECYEKLQYIDAGLSDRDCLTGEHFKYTQNWISYTLKNAGYASEDIDYQEVEIQKFNGFYAQKGLSAKKLKQL
ncbi:MAG: hypothetical protein ACI4SH_06210, partial [Candidatus Scatosoma sp.]